MGKALSGELSCPCDRSCLLLKWGLFIKKSPPVAQWVKRCPTDLAVPSSSPARGEIFSTVNGVPLHTHGVVGWYDGTGKTSSAGASYNLDDSRARAYCACSRCGWGLFGHSYSGLSFHSSFSLSLGDGPI